MENKIKNIIEAMEWKDVETKDERAIIKDTCDKELKDILINQIYDENIGGIYDLSYTICIKACDFFDNLSEEDIKDLNNSELLDEYVPSSVYTSDRLEYLNGSNESEVMDIIREYSTNDISIACAVWFDNKVKEVIGVLVEYINKQYENLQ